MSEDDKLSWLKSGLAIRVAAEVDKRGVTTHGVRFVTLQKLLKERMQ